MKIFLCFILLFCCFGCEKNKDSECPVLKRYSIRYSVDIAKGCPKDVAWQDFLYDYSISHGPIFNPEEKKEYTKFRAK